MKYSNIREEELKNKVWQDFFANFDTTEIVWNIDFCVTQVQQDLFWITAPLLWAEAKTGDYDIYAMITQLVLTIWKARTFDKTLPPVFLWAFDYKKIAFVKYIEIQDIFFMNDFNRNVTPSNHDTKEFKLVYDRIVETLDKQTMIFDYEEDEDKLRYFIKNWFWLSRTDAKIRINKNNFLPIYLRRVQFVKPLIDIKNRDDLKKNNILDSDFFLADLFVDDRNTINVNDDESVKSDLFVMFENGWYKISKDNMNSMFDAIIQIRNKTQYELFWKNYKRPPSKQYQEYIILRRDLLVPQDIRERKWAFFTPRIWVEKSQEYMANYFGDNYQDEYYIWDCCAWTGNLLAWLTNKYNIYASTLDNADVIVMKDMIKNKTINLLENHVFQFDFLNDEFSKLPQNLQDIIKDEEKRKKLIIYINPPYAEATNAKTVAWTWENKAWTSIENKTREKYKSEIWKASNELFTQFLIRIYKEIPNCNIANFSKLKNLQSENFSEFRKSFLAKLEKIFIVPGNTFDNVRWQFPIWFYIWNCDEEQKFTEIIADIYNRNWEYIWQKKLQVDDGIQSINKRIKNYEDKSDTLWLLVSCAPDFQHNNQLAILSNQQKRYCFNISKKNLLNFCIYFSVRHCIEATWLNDRDQFLRPKDERENDIEFQNDCICFTLFNWQNFITSNEGKTNHRIPFTEKEVNSREKFSSHFMSDFIKNRTFSEEAKNVINVWKDLRSYYHKNADKNSYLADASLYEIREYFQWRNDSGKMNNKSDDEKYNELIWNLREKLKILWDKIAEKVYEYEFLKR